MADSVTPEYLLKGAVYSLEQCGLLLRDAALLYRNTAYASAVVLAAFGREALGQWIILLDLRKEVISGTRFTIAQIKERCGDHVQKQKAGMRSVTLRADRDTALGRLIMSRITAPQGTAEAEKTEAALADIDRRKKRAVPTQRHEQRVSALYVDPIEPLSVDRWTRPSIEISRELARVCLQDARNDYSIQSCNRYNAVDILKDLDPELYQALEQWRDRPTLPLPEGPLPS
jgi:AbiV family abortive infection protein